jgi:hypothetical protein
LGAAAQAGRLLEQSEPTGQILFSQQLPQLVVAAVEHPHLLLGPEAKMGLRVGLGVAAVLTTQQHHRVEQEPQTKDMLVEPRPFMAARQTMVRLAVVVLAQ